MNGNRNNKKSEPENVVVFLPNWVGDVVMATPILRALRESENFSHSKITYFGRAIALAVLQGNSWADGEVLDQSRQKPRLKSFLRTARKLRALKPDLAILLPNSFRSAMLARLSGATRRVGYDRGGRGWLLTDKLAPQRQKGGGFKPQPMIDYYAHVVDHLGLELGSRKMELPVSSDDQAAADAILAEAGYVSQPQIQKTLVMLNPGASFGTSKLWPAERYAEVADELIERCNAQIIINAAPSEFERQLAGKVASAMRNKPIINFSERDNTLGLLKALASRCKLLITNDTGTRHIGAAVGAAVVTIFGSTDPVWAEIDYPAERIVRAEVACSPCQQKFCPLPQGPEHHICMTALSSDDVLKAAMEFLS